MHSNLRCLRLVYVFTFFICLRQVAGRSDYFGYYADIAERNAVEARKLPPVPVEPQECPFGCSCHGKSVNCAKRRLRDIPKPLPKNVERLNLQGNRISRIRKADFRNLKNLRILQLMDNGLQEIEAGAFDDLLSLERLRLNRNKLKEIPGGLFQHQSKLYRLDISHNQLSFLGMETLQGAPNIKNLQLDHNSLRCVTESSLKRLHRLEILTLNKNNLTSLPANVFSRMSSLRVLRLADNDFLCDCRLAWLSKWLLSHPQLGLFTKCANPSLLKGAQVAELRTTDFQCSADHDKLHPPACSMVQKSNCPSACNCQENIVRCNQKGLTQIPEGIPLDVQELHLEGNAISTVPARAFSRYPELRRLFLNDNRITHLSADGFQGLSNLYSLVLSRNAVSELPRGVFRHLKGLQLLLLDANRISCLPDDAFKASKNLVILSLYKNKLKSLANGTFDKIQLSNMQQLILAGNPWTCDCNLRWLNAFLQELPRLANGGTACAGPQRMKGKKLGVVKTKKLRCKEGEGGATRNAGSCELYSECPKSCRCSEQEVDCSGTRLKDLPDNLPLSTTHLKLANNNIKVIKAKSILQKLVKLRSL